MTRIMSIGDETIAAVVDEASWTEWILSGLGQSFFAVKTLDESIQNGDPLLKLFPPEGNFLTNFTLRFFAPHKS